MGPARVPSRQSLTCSLYLRSYSFRSPSHLLFSFYFLFFPCSCRTMDIITMHWWWMIIILQRHLQASVAQTRAPGLVPWIWTVDLSCSKRFARDTLSSLDYQNISSHCHKNFEALYFKLTYWTANYVGNHWEISGWNSEFTGRSKWSCLHFRVTSS